MSMETLQTIGGQSNKEKNAIDLIKYVMKFIMGRQTRILTPPFQKPVRDSIFEK